MVGDVKSERRFVVDSHRRAKVSAKAARALLASMLVALAAIVAVSASARAEIRRDEFRVRSEAGIEIFVREVRDTDAAAAGRGKPPVILLHGARVPGIASFDLPVAGGSLAADLARAGCRVFVMDARGYGASTRMPAMDGPPGAGQPLVGSHEVVRDIAAVVEAVERRAGADKVALIGWATGGHWVGMYAALHPEEVSHLVIYNALYGVADTHPTLGRGSNLEAPGQPGRFNVAQYGAYRLNTGDGLLPSWDRAIPVEDKSAWRDPKVAEAYVEAALASDPTARTRNPPSFRAPSGAMQDSYYLATGRQLWDAASITADVLILRSDRDFWSRPEDVTTLRDHLVQAGEVRAVTLPDATHHVHLDRPERGRARFLSEVTAFLAQPQGTTGSAP